MSSLIRVAEVVGFGIVRPTPLNARFDQQLLSPNIVVAELRWLQPLLGKELYEDMIAKQYAGDSNPPTLPKFPTNAAYEALWTALLWQFNARAVVIESIDTIGLHIAANGLFLPNSETADNAGVSGIKYKTDRLREQLETLQSAIKDYLCENIADFPLYDSDKCSTCADENKPTRKFGIVITNKMKNNGRNY